MTDTCNEAWVSEFWERANASGQKIPLFLAFNPRLTARVIRRTINLPRLEARLSAGIDGRLIYEGLKRICLTKIFRLADTGLCVLAVPEARGEYRLGAKKQTLRRKIRSAEKAGVICRPITNQAEQAEIVQRLDQAYRAKADIRYRDTNSDHSSLVGVGLWTAAFASDGQPLAVAITPTDGAWAMLRVFVTLGDSPQHSDARYLLTDAVVDRLSEEGVRYLFDTRSPAELPNGLRHFQRMLGFQIFRVRVSRESGTACGSASAGKKEMNRKTPAAEFLASCLIGYSFADVGKRQWQSILASAESCAPIRDSAICLATDLAMAGGLMAI